LILERSSGFLYLLARVGTTGERHSFESGALAKRVALIRSASPLPVAVGFGISTAEHVREVVRTADAAIVGSALVRRMGDAPDPVAAAGVFIGRLAAGLDGRSA
jgi:tryptophan synthase alpha subunit